MRSFMLLFFVFALIPSNLCAQNVYIPDSNLLDALIDHGVDTNDDSFISFDEATAVLSLTLVNGIRDMTGHSCT